MNLEITENLFPELDFGSEFCAVLGPCLPLGEDLFHAANRGLELRENPLERGMHSGSMVGACQEPRPPREGGDCMRYRRRLEKHRSEVEPKLSLRHRTDRPPDPVEIRSVSVPKRAEVGARMAILFKAISSRLEALDLEYFGIPEKSIFRRGESLSGSQSRDGHCAM